MAAWTLRQPSAREMAPALLACVAALDIAWGPVAIGASSASAPLLPLVRSPAVYQLDARVVTRELTLRKGSPATLNDLSDRELNEFAESGFDAIYLMGVWQTGDRGELHAQQQLPAMRAAAAPPPAPPPPAGADVVQESAALKQSTDTPLEVAAAEQAAQEKLEEVFRGRPRRARSAPLIAVGAADRSQRRRSRSAPAAVIEYSVHADLGGDEALAELRKRLHARGLRVFLDFVANHVAANHPWTVTNPQYLVRGSPEELEREPHNYYCVGQGAVAGIFAHGRDPYFDGWEDTVQLNYASDELQEQMCLALAKVASMCDGVRCEMAMLQCPTVFQKTWRQNLDCNAGEAGKEFWPRAIAEARRINQDLLLIGEVYRGGECGLQGYGFDYTLDRFAFEQARIVTCPQFATDEGFRIPS
jgi:hypothetical protein